MPKAAKHIVISLLAVVLCLLVLAAIYAAYFLSSRYRLDDNLALDITHPSTLVATQPTEDTVYTIASYNLGFGAYSDDFSFFMDGGNESVARSEDAVRENIGGAMRVLEGLNSDLVLLQEVDIDGTRSRHVNERELVDEMLPAYADADFAQNYDSPFIFYPINEPHGANRSGIYTMSKFGISSVLRRSLPIDEGPSSLFDLDRCYSKSVIPLAASDGSKGASLVVYNLHLSAYTADGKVVEEQLSLLMDDMLGEYRAGNWTIAGGDFNRDLLGNSSFIFGRELLGNPTWALPIPRDQIPEDLKLVVPFEVENRVPSCRNADHPYDDESLLLTIDGFVVSSNVSVLESTVADTGFRYSDHNPVVMRFCLS